MSALDEPRPITATEEPAPATASGPLTGDPMALGLPCFIAGSVSLGQTAVASVFGIFGGFWLSYAVLVLGLTHNWFGVSAPAVQATEELFLVAWLVIIVMLTLATLRLPLAFTAVFALVDVALLLVFLGVNQANTDISKAGGYVALAFAALGAYLFFGTASQATGGPAIPLGRPIIR